MDSSAEVKSLTRLASVAESAGEALPPEVRGVGSSTRARAIALSSSSVRDDGACDVCSTALARTELLGSAESAEKSLAAAEVRTAGAELMWVATSRGALR